MAAARVTPRVFLSKWWLIRFNKTDAALCRTGHFDKWGSHSSLHQQHSKALRTDRNSPDDFKHALSASTEQTRFFTSHLNQNLRRDFFNWNFLNPQLGGRKSEECGTGFELLCPALLGGYKAMPGAHSHNGDGIYFISLLSALRKKDWVSGDARTVHKATSVMK